MELLTRDGWRDASDVDRDDELATVDLNTDRIEFRRPVRVGVREHAGGLIRINNRRLSVSIPADHKIVVYSRGSDAPGVKAAKSLSAWDRIKVKTARYDGAPRCAPVAVKIARGVPSKINPLVWAEFLGWYVAEGSYGTPQCPGHGYRVTISQTTEQQVVRRLLDRTPWAWGYHSGDFYTSSKWLWDFVSPLGKVHEKYVPDWIMRSDSGTVKAFLRGAVAGDGWIESGLRRYATVSRRLADQVQALFLLSGSAATISTREPTTKAIRGQAVGSCRTQYHVRELKTRVVYLRDSRNASSVKRVDGSGPVASIEVPNGAMIARSNGKPFVIGNQAP